MRTALKPWLPLIARILQVPLVLLVIVTISFLMMRLAPGGPFLSERGMDPVALEALRAKHGFDQPLIVQYGSYIGGLVQGDLGPSLVQKGRSVNEIIATYLPTSLLLGFAAILMALAAGLTAGTIAAVRRNGVFDHTTMTLTMVGVSVPNFVIAPILQAIFGLWLDWLPSAGYEGWRNPMFLILPAATLAAPFAARIAALTRAGLLECLQQDHVRSARARGLHPVSVVLKHVLRGGLIPVVGFMGPAVASMLTGSLVVEKIFQIPGLGLEFVQSATNRDFTLVMGTVIVYSLAIVLCNALADLALLWMDPRGRSRG